MIASAAAHGNEAVYTQPSHIYAVMYVIANSSELSEWAKWVINIGRLLSQQHLLLTSNYQSSQRAHTNDSIWRGKWL